VKLLVTGGAGFIGSHVVDGLTSRGDTVVTLDSFDDAYDPAYKRLNCADSSARVVMGDVCDPTTVRSALRGVDVVVHLAARAGVRESLVDRELYVRSNVTGTEVLLAEMVRSGVGRLVAASSSSVYGARTQGPFSESDPVEQQVSPYGVTKRETERLCETAARKHEMAVTCLRFFTVYGPRQRPGMAIAKFVRLGLASKTIELYGEGSSRDYTFVGDAVSAVLRSVDTPLAYEVINVGTGRQIALEALVDAVGVAIERPLQAQRLPAQPGDVPLTWADAGKAARLLHWRAQTPLAEGLRSYVNWLTRANIIKLAEPR